ncbi:hypothetical protein, partial [Salmonella sp. SAL4434]|uniref:hypothetical protein n=1 Tax=Salmonella sp. SAL4434 TaxID=3159889 RepID=UPI00397B3FD7
QSTEFLSVGWARIRRIAPVRKCLIVKDLVSPEGIDHGKARPKADAVWLIVSGEPIWRPKAENW